MKLRYQYRIYPNKEQQANLAKLFGCTRVVWNDALATIKAIPRGEKWPTSTELSKQCITQAKKTVERSWLSDVSAVPLQQSLIDLGTAFKNFFDSRKGKRKGKPIQFPRFKKRDNKQTARFAKTAFSLKGNKVYLAKIGTVKTKWSRPLPSEPSSVTVIKDRQNHYYLSFVVEAEPSMESVTNPSIGIDLGIKVFAFPSYGEPIEGPDYSKLDRKLRKAQRVLSRRQKGSKRRERARLRVAKLKAKARNIRKDFLHKLSTQLVKENQVICLEDLNVSGMVKNRKLSRAISQQGWREFRTMLEAKAAMYGREVRVIDRWEPTSQYCSDCGSHWGKLDLSVREIRCLSCGALHDRDRNAAKNINFVGAGDSPRQHKNGQGSTCKTGLPAGCVEPSSRLVGEQLRLNL